MKVVELMMNVEVLELLMMKVVGVLPSSSSPPPPHYLRWMGCLMSCWNLKSCWKWLMSVFFSWCSSSSWQTSFFFLETLLCSLFLFLEKKMNINIYFIYILWEKLVSFSLWWILLFPPSFLSCCSNCCCSGSEVCSVSRGVFILLTICQPKPIWSPTHCPTIRNDYLILSIFHLNIL